MAKHNHRAPVVFHMSPLLAGIYKRVEELRREASSSPVGISTVSFPPKPTTEAERRIAELEQYIFPWRNKFEVHRGPRVTRVHAAFHALEDWLADPEATWGTLARRHGFPHRRALECAVRRVKLILKRESIALPRRAR